MKTTAKDIVKSIARNRTFLRYEDGKIITGRYTHIARKGGQIILRDDRGEYTTAKVSVQMAVSVMKAVPVLN